MSNEEPLRDLRQALGSSVVGALSGFLALWLGRSAAFFLLSHEILPHPGGWLGPWWPWTALPIILLPPAVVSLYGSKLSWRGPEGRATAWGTFLLVELAALGHVFLPVQLSLASLYATPFLGVLGGMAGHLLRLEAERVAGLG